MPFLASQFSRILTGYCAGALVFGCSSTALAILTGDAGVTGITGFLSVASFMAACSAIVGFPVCALFIALTERFDLRRLIVYVLGGALAGGLWLLMLGNLSINSESLPTLAVCALSASMAGLAYWAIAGRHAGTKIDGAR